MNITALSLGSASASLSTLESKESATTVLLDTTTIATPTNAFASLDSGLLVDSVNPSALSTRPTSTESANATMDFLLTMENALPQGHARSTATLTTIVNAAFATPDSQSSTENAPAINTADRMAIFDMASAIARRDISGSLELADRVVPMKHSTVSYASALLDTPAVSMEYAVSLTLFPTARITSNTIANSRPASVFKELPSSEENVKSSQPAQPTPTSTEFSVSATQGSFSVNHNASAFR